MKADKVYEYMGFALRILEEGEGTFRSPKSLVGEAQHGETRLRTARMPGSWKRSAVLNFIKSKVRTHIAAEQKADSEGVAS